MGHCLVGGLQFLEGPSSTGSQPYKMFAYTDIPESHCIGIWALRDCAIIIYKDSELEARRDHEIYFSGEIVSVSCSRTALLSPPQLGSPQDTCGTLVTLGFLPELVETRIFDYIGAITGY